MDYLSTTENETKNIAIQLSKKLVGGDVVLLSGDLGSGKTTFTKYLGQALGLKRIITSPTFVILKKYPLDHELNGIKEMVHVDCYRMGSANDAESVGLIEYLARPDILTIIEWPEKISEVLPKNSKQLNFEYVDECTRKIGLNL